MNRDPVSLGEHALLVRHIVAALRLAPGGMALAGAHSASAEESSARSDRGAGAGASGGGPDRSPQSGADDRADGGSAHRALYGGVARRAGPLPRPASTDGVIGLEDLERFAGTRQHHLAGACRDRRAGTEDDGRERSGYPRTGSLRRHWVGDVVDGGTGIQPPGHCWTYG
jgi:hypothetical protein